jgi:hypothetical protein
MVQLQITESIRSHQTRETAIQIGNKLIQTPLWMPKIRKKFELDLLVDNTFPKSNIRGVVYDIFDVMDITHRKEQGLRQQTIFGEVSEKGYHEFKNSNITIIDPCMEYFYSRVQDKREKYLALVKDSRFVADKETKNLLVDMLINSDTKTHFKYWHRLMEGDYKNDLVPILTAYLKFQGSLNVDVIIPPVPYMDGSSPKFVDYCIQVNKLTQDLAKYYTMATPVAIYLPLSYRMFYKASEQLKSLIEFLQMKADNEFNGPRLIFFKIKDYDFHKSREARDNLRDFFTLLNIIAEKQNKASFMLDTDSLGLVAISQGIDGFSGPLDFYIRDFRGSGEGIHEGAYYNSDELIPQRYIDLLKVYKKRGHYLVLDLYAST